MDLLLNDWRVIVTGGTDGIGRAIAALLVEEGASVVACGRNPAHRPPPGVCADYYGDLSEMGTPAEIVKFAVSRLGGIDALIAAGGASVPGTLCEAGDEDWDEALQINLFSNIRLIREALPFFGTAGGRIVLVTALSGREPRAQHPIPNVGKAGLAAFGKSLSLDLARRGILVNCVAPGRIRSGQLDRAYSTDEARAQASRDAGIVLERFGLPEELAPFAVMLASPRNTYVTGHTMVVDGGMSRAV